MTVQGQEIMLKTYCRTEITIADKMVCWKQLKTLGQTQAPYLKKNNLLGTEIADKRWKFSILGNCSRGQSCAGQQVNI